MWQGNGFVANHDYLSVCLQPHIVAEADAFQTDIAGLIFAADHNFSKAFRKVFGEMTG